WWWNTLLYVDSDGVLNVQYVEPNPFSFFRITSDGPVNDGRWHDVALVFDGSAQTLNVYLDGRPLGSASESSPGAFTVFANYNQVGTGYTQSTPDTPGGWYGFVGQIRNVRIWNGVRTAGQIQQDMTAVFSSTEPGLVADYPLDEGRGTTAYD